MANTQQKSPARVDGNRLFAEIINLRNMAGETCHFRRVQLAALILKDRAWVEAPEGGGGNESIAIQRLEDDGFPDLVGLVRLPELLELYHEYPDVAAWRKGKFDMKRMAQAVRARKYGPKQKQKGREFSVERHGLVPPLSFPNLSEAQQRKEYAKAFDQENRWMARALKAEAKVEQLEAENKELRRELQSTRARRYA